MRQVSTELTTRWPPLPKLFSTMELEDIMVHRNVIGWIFTVYLSVCEKQLVWQNVIFNNQVYVRYSVQSIILDELGECHESCNLFPSFVSIAFLLHIFFWRVINNPNPTQRPYNNDEQNFHNQTKLVLKDQITSFVTLKFHIYSSGSKEGFCHGVIFRSANRPVRQPSPSLDSAFPRQSHSCLPSN